MKRKKIYFQYQPSSISSNTLAIDKTQTTSCRVVYYSAMIYYIQIRFSAIDETKVLALYNIFNAQLNLLCAMRISFPGSIEAIASLGFNNCQDQKSLLAQKT